MTQEEALSLAIAQAQAEAEPSRLASLGRGAADTFTFGFDDEILAGIRSLGGADYSTEQRKLEESKRQAQEANPWTFGAGQLAGAVPSFFVPGGAVARGATLAGKVGKGAAAGAGLGGLYGAGSNSEDRLLGAAEGAAIGAPIGGAFPLAAAGAGAAWRGAGNALRSNRIARRAGQSPETMRVVGSAMQADETLGARGQANMAAAGREAMVADAGPNAKALLDTSIQRGGPGAVKASRAISERVKRDARRFSDVLDQTLGAPEGITAARTAIRKGSEKVRKRAYTAAYESPIDYSKPLAREMEDILNERVTPDVVNEANRLMKLRGESSKQINAIVGNDGSVIFETLPDVRQIDYMTRALNQLAESGEGQGALGGQTTLGSAYKGLSREIRSRLRELVPNYAEALDTAADPIERAQAVEFGGKLLSRGITRDQAAEAINGMSRAEKAAAAQGLRSSIDDMMANVSRTIQDHNVDAREAIKGLKELSSRANRSKVELIIGQEKASTLFKEIDRIAKSFDLRASVTENSKTYARLATQRRFDQLTEPNPLLEGRAVGRGSLLSSVTGNSPAARAAKQDKLWSHVSEILAQPPGGARPTFKAITDIMRADGATQGEVQMIENWLSRLGYPATVQSRENIPPGLRLTK